MGLDKRFYWLFCSYWLEAPNALLHLRGSATFVGETAVGVFEMAVQFLCSAGEGGFDVS